MKEGFAKRHRIFCEGFGIPIGSKIKVPGWCVYEAREDGFYNVGVGYRKNIVADGAYIMIIERGFEFYEED